MSAHWADVLILAGLLAAVWRGVAVGVALALAGLAGIALHAPGWRPALAVLGAEAAGVLAREPMWMAALFLLMATALGRSGLAGAIFARLAEAWEGRARLLSAATVLFAAVLGALSGSVLASAGALRQMALEPLIAAGESPPRAAAVIAAGASLSTLIPPSLVLVFYAAFADVPVLHVFAAALLPGLVGAGLTAAAALLGHPGRMAGSTAAGASRAGSTPPASARKVAMFAGLFLAIFVLLYAGRMTPLEVAAFGAAAAAGFRLVGMPRRLCVWLGEAQAAAEEIAAILIVLLGAFVFSVYLALSGLPERAIAGLAAHDWPARFVLPALLAGYLLLGMVLEPIALVVASLPLSLPLVEALGYSPLWWAAVLASVAATGLLTPPMGLAVFTATAGRTMPTAQVFRETGVFLAADMARLALLVAWPALATALPEYLAATG